MGMRVGGAGNSAAMAAWQAQQRQIAASATSTQPAAKPVAQLAAAAQSSAEQQVATALSALATGSTFSRLA